MECASESGRKLVEKTDERTIAQPVGAPLQSKSELGEDRRCVLRLLEEAHHVESAAKKKEAKTCEEPNMNTKDMNTKEAHVERDRGSAQDAEGEVAEFWTADEVNNRNVADERRHKEESREERYVSRRLEKDRREKEEVDGRLEKESKEKEEEKKRLEKERDEEKRRLENERREEEEEKRRLEKERRENEETRRLDKDREEREEVKRRHDKDQEKAQRGRQHEKISNLAAKEGSDDSESFVAGGKLSGLTNALVCNLSGLSLLAFFYFPVTRYQGKYALDRPFVNQ